MGTTLQFLGAARTVTGSCFLVQHGPTRVLVDCGLVQGPANLTARNRLPFGFDPSALDAVVLTHAHLDHTGLVPRLLAEGFRGRMFTTSVTKDLLPVVWDDFVRLQQPPPGFRRGSPARHEEAPLYSDPDVERALSRCEGHPYDKTLSLAPSLRARFRDAGHILGSAIVELWAGDLKLVFSGDLGHRNKPIVRDPTGIDEGQVLVLESTYGDRNHRGMAETVEELGQVIAGTLASGGSVLMPVYAIGRSQDVLYVIYQLTLKGILNHPRVFLDSPMAIQAAEVYGRHLEAFDEEASRLVRHPPRNPRAPRVKFTESMAESRGIARVNRAIILAGSGMCEGGRIEGHLARHLDDPRSCVIFTGYQVQGTLGRRLVDGATQVRLMGRTMPVRAKIHTINGLSAHADQAGLLEWVGGFRDPKPRTFLVHGEPEKMTALAGALDRRFGIKATMPEWGETAALGTVPPRRSRPSRVGENPPGPDE